MDLAAARLDHRVSLDCQGRFLGAHTRDYHLVLLGSLLHLFEVLFLQHLSLVHVHFCLTFESLAFKADIELIQRFSVIGRTFL